MQRRENKVLVGLTIERYKEIEPAVILGLVRLLGLEFVEITKTVFEDLERVVSKMDGMQCGFHLPILCEDGWDFSARSAAEKIDELIDSINANRTRLRVRHVVCHPPEVDGRPTIDPDAVNFLLSNLSRLELPAYLENVPRMSLGDYLDFYRTAREQLGPKVAGMCYDGPHYLLTGLDPVEQLQRLDGEIGCVHLSDCTLERDDHLPFGRGGAMPIPEILKTLKANHFNGIVNLEIRPENFHDVLPTIDSYLEILKVFRPRKYWGTKARLWFLYPVIRRVLA